jgi:hypothetical protein
MYRRAAEDLYLKFQKSSSGDSHSARVKKLRASLDLLCEHQALDEPAWLTVYKEGVSLDRLIAESFAGAAKDRAAKEEAEKRESLKVMAAKEEAAKEEENAEGISEEQSSVKAIGDAQPSERTSTETAMESAVALKEEHDVSSKAGIKHDLQNGNEAGNPTGNPTRDDNLPLKCPKCGETFTYQIQLDDQALDFSPTQFDQSSHAKLEPGELAVTTHHDDIPTVQTLRELEAQRANSRQQRDLFMDGFVQRGRQRLLAIDEWETEACLRASQAKDTTSVKIARHVEEINQLVNQKHQEEMQAAHDQGAYEAMEQELEALEARKKELLAKMSK